MWQVRDAEARFSEFLERAVAEGPQIVTKRGVPTAVLVSMEQWHSLSKASKPDLKELLLAPEPRTEELALPRRLFRYRVASRYRS